MVTVSHSGNTQTIRGYTTNSSDGAAAPLWTELGDTTGAPWEINIKSVARDSDADWGTSTYSLPFTPADAGGSGTINEAEAKVLGNSIHRVLKYYLGNRYHLSNIAAVTLNIALKSSPQTLQ